MKYGDLEPTGVVERRGARHALHLECTCVCGTKKFVRKDALEQGKVVTCGQTHGGSESLPKHDYVKTKDNSGRFAVGEPDELRPWGPFINAREMSRQEAESWVVQRIKYRAQNGLLPGKYQIVTM